MILDKKKMEYFDWWQKRIETLKGYGKEAQKLYELTRTCYPAHSWTILKLALLTYYFDIYTKIIKSRYKQAFYIDLCAGCGLNYIEETGDIVLGSALLADRIPHPNKKFDQLFLMEQNKEYAASLMKIFQSQQNVKVLQGDSNRLITNVLSEIEEQQQAHFLAFIDPEGTEISWQTIEILLKSRGDIIINYMCAGIKRIWGKAVEGNEKSIENMNRFFGDDLWRKSNISDGKQLFNIYFEKVKRFKEKSMQVMVKGPWGFHYHIIFAVRRTGGAQGWLKAIEEAKKKIEEASHEDAEKFLQIFSGKQKTLDSAKKGSKTLSDFL
ncbi:MAG: three-Cys-motif partner protein TcmP [Archaeoglobaceae archaeon]